ncbi:hypothetical protein TWF730_001716 [Orbilia blumenaviensis]|uniref:Uncharacterized protein n=1 Tax=Orbilia blumenaviensis TaxID=1796055 RepID=A0AAV9UM64_9PEZI
MLSGILANGQTYVAESIIIFATTSRLLSDSRTKSPISLDKLKLRKAMRERSLIFEPRNNWLKSLISMLWLLFWQIPAVLWVGSITPVVRLVENSGIQIAVPVANYSSTSFGLWATDCPPEALCDKDSVAKLLGGSFDEGTFSYVPWRTKTGLLLNAISQASSQDSSSPRNQKLDNTGYAYRGRSYGVGASVGLANLQVVNGVDDETNISIDLIRSYFYYEDGYKASVHCQKNDSRQLYFSKLDTARIASEDNDLQAYWASGSLPNGKWKGFPTWGISKNDSESSAYEGPRLGYEYITALAAVKDQDRYIYGFLAGRKYWELDEAQCEVTFTPTRFNISVDVGIKEVTVAPLPLQNKILPADIDINPSRNVVNNSFYGVSYLSQVSTTLYTSVLGDAFYRNIDNVRKSHGRETAVLDDTLEAIEQGLELLLDSFLGSVSAAQLMIANDTKLATGKVVTLEAVQLGNTFLATALLGLVGLVCAGTILGLSYLWGRYSISWNMLGDHDFLDYKSAIVGVAKGAGYSAAAIVNWKGDSNDREVGKLKITAVDNTSLKLGDKPNTSSDTSSSSLPLRV